MDKPETIAFWRGQLPHWTVDRGRYFVTIHLRGAIPVEGLEHLSRMRQQMDRAVRSGQQGLRWQSTVFRRMESYLDTASHADYLQRPEVASVVRDAIQHRHENGTWVAYEYTLMPSHLHLFLRVLDGSLKSTLIAFKRWTSRIAAPMIGVEGAEFWQDEWFDHWSRRAEEDERICTYIQQNPVKAGLVANFEDWPWRGPK